MKKQIEEIKDCIDSIYGCDCAYFGVDGLTIAEALYNAGYRKQEWISVEERLPDRNYNDFVLAWNGMHVEFLHYNHRYKQWEDYYSLKEHPWKVTHWMPLPEPPKGERKMECLDKNKLMREVAKTFGSVGVISKAIEGIADKCTTADVVTRSDYEQLLDDFEHALHYAGKNNNVCNFCEHDCGEGGVCKGRNDFIHCNPKWRGIVRSSAEGE